jgi:hypothetical protein
MKNLMLFLFILLPFMSMAQTFNFNGTAVKSIGVNEEHYETVTGKTGYVIFSDSTVIYFLSKSEMCHKEYKDTMEVTKLLEMAYDGIGYIISPTEYFVKYPHKALYIRKVGENWIYETLKP